MKTLKYIALLMSASVLLSSCQKELLQEPAVPEDVSMELVAGEGQIICAVPAVVPDTKTATGVAAEDGSYPVVWLDKDMVKVYGKNDPSGVIYRTDLEEWASSAVFTAESQPVTGNVKYAVYPAALAGEMSGDRISVSLETLRKQEYHSSIENFGKFDNYKDVFETFDEQKANYELLTVFPHLPMFAKAENGSNFFAFENLFGAVKIKLNDYQGNGVTVSSIKLISDKYVSGTMSVATDGTFILEGSTDEEKTIEMVSSKGTKICDATPALSDGGYGFYFFLPVGVYENGFAFEITDTEGRVYTKTTGKSVTVSAGAVKSYPTLQLTLYYGKANSYRTTTKNTVEVDVTPFYTFSDRLTYDGTPVGGAEQVFVPEIVWQIQRGGKNLQGQVIVEEPVIDGNVMTVKTNYQGNALVAIKNADDEIVWSYHIWVTDQAMSDLPYNVNGETFYMMDANLGATYAKVENPESAYMTYGMFYQWGRKEPLPAYGTDVYLDGVIALFDMEINAEATISYGIKHPLTATRTVSDNTPTTFIQTAKNNVLWGASDSHKSEDAIFNKVDGFVKTVYDPCPEGYMMPQAYHFSGLTVAVAARTGYGALLSYDDSEDQDYYALPGRFLYDAGATSGVTKAQGNGVATRYQTSNPYGTGGWASCFFSVEFTDSAVKVNKTYGAQANIYQVRCLKMPENN